MHAKRIFAMKARLAAMLLAAAGSYPGAAQVTSTTLEADVENIVSYSSNVFDASKFASDPNLSTAAPARNFGLVGRALAVNEACPPGSFSQAQPTGTGD